MFTATVPRKTCYNFGKTARNVLCLAHLGVWGGGVYWNTVFVGEAREMPAGSGKLRVVVADDNPSSVDTIVAILGSKFDVVAAEHDGVAALQAIRNFKPDVAVLDLAMPGLDGIGVTRTALAAQADLAVVICSVYGEADFVRAAIDAGVRGYVLKVNIFRDLANAVDAVGRGQTFFPASFSAAEPP